ncbi:MULTISPECIES: DUF4256 domain-containing protein [Eggerthella]|uniref:DUF4256 domain-containing protein n=1 Tax=Eggerthella TaxID=84111 RepID=UPI000DF82F82|nr:MULTISPECIES: DUF4256 domain-containing protein [Eggerthella]MDU6849593.1 DUF4256 domain-containing protein [Eggerthella sp.]MDB1777950.1 DUF4256 domain-containing protein [Eggerthella lenta]MZJ95000.1 DUF4256 domain-containing protein [Eggerthella sp. BIOML-A3]MZJ99421.1 DUF4256 domain-containing protein [Eggerthella sp. BIOML-A1]MZK35480.1 DUF4256 domain-containing protein [Eggerthella sp. BIOML-A5]
METANTLTVQQRTALLDTLQARFERNERLHPGIAWENVRAKLEADDGKLRSLFAMEKTGGQPDVVAYDHAADAYVFYDCAPESPAGRRNLCYDRAAWEARKRNKPEGNVVDAAAAMGIALLTEAQYRALQELGEFDVKTSSWIETPAEVRALGGALFCDRRFNRVFTFHNGAESYYASGGFRRSLRV